MCADCRVERSDGARVLIGQGLKFAVSVAGNASV